MNKQIWDERTKAGDCSQITALVVTLASRAMLFSWSWDRIVVYELTRDRAQIW